MTFYEWYDTAERLRGDELPEHIAECEISVAVVFEDGSFVTQYDDGTYGVLLGNVEPQFADLYEAARELWSEHAQFNYE